VRLTREIKPDLVHANSIRAGMMAAGAAGRTGVPTIAHVHDRLPGGRASAFMLNRMLHGVDGVLACSAYAAEPLRALDPSSPVKVVYNPVDVERFDPDAISREAARSSLGLGESTAVLAMVANFMWLPYYPLWAITLIGLNVAVIWALAVVEIEPDFVRPAP
jgi:glycosyltransferase involved in cell wall biosynthesis